jgi:hypothetical protein
LKIRFAGWRHASTAAFAQQPAGCVMDQVQARAGRTHHGVVRFRGIGPLGGKPMLHVHAGLRALEDNMTVHVAPEYDGGGPRPKLRMIA